jgi:hypothetical protein
MRQLVPLLVVAACGAQPGPRIENQAPDQPPPKPPSISGLVRNLTTGELLAGTTIILIREGDDKPTKEAISDERGAYSFEPLEPGTYDLHFYYLDVSVIRSVAVRTALQIDQAIPIERGGEQLRCTNETCTP